jgi:hypothetical protein
VRDRNRILYGLVLAALAILLIMAAWYFFETLTAR